MSRLPDDDERKHALLYDDLAQYLLHMASYVRGAPCSDSLTRSIVMDHYSKLQRILRHDMGSHTLRLALRPYNERQQCERINSMLTFGQTV